MGKLKPGQHRTMRKNTVFVRYKQRDVALYELAKEYGIGYWTLRNRILNLGWPVERAITEKVQSPHGNSGDVTSQQRVAHAFLVRLPLLSLAALLHELQGRYDG